MDDGILLIDKPEGVTSFGVVARIRRVLTQRAGKRVKVGHTGTLDPFATGLMIIVTGKECKNASSYSKLDKVYEATIQLGKTSTTGDPEGEITLASPREPTRQEVEKVLASLRGEILQTPPIYSAIKVGGRRAYQLARAGQEVIIPTRTVTIHQTELLEYAYPGVKIRAHVSSGTYIRTLAEDIGKALGTGAYCTQLRRTQIANWTIDDAQTLQSFGITD